MIDASSVRSGREFAVEDTRDQHPWRERCWSMAAAACCSHRGEQTGYGALARSSARTSQSNDSQRAGAGALPTPGGSAPRIPGATPSSVGADAAIQARECWVRLWVLRQLTAEGRLKEWLDDYTGNLLEPLVPRVS